jgi:putative transport protein
MIPIGWAKRLALLLAGCICTLTPLLVGTLFGRYVMKMNPVLLVVAGAGAQTTTPSLGGHPGAGRQPDAGA